MIDVNCLTATDANYLAEFDIEDDGALKAMIGGWMKARFEEYDAQNRAEMRALLEQSKQWTTEQLTPVFAEVGIPSGQTVKDIDRFMAELRYQILT